MVSPVGIILNTTLSNYSAPHVEDWYPNIPPQYLIAAIFAALATVSVLALGALHLYFVIRYVKHPSMQTDLYWIVLLAPIVALCNGVGVLVPRTGAFLYSVGIVYYIMCTFILLTLMTTLYGSRDRMSKKLLEKEITLNPRVMPIGCCLLCIPNMQPTRRNIRFLEWAVFQSVIVRVIIEIVSIAVYNELETKDHVVFTVMNIVSFLSLTFASYSTYILFPAGCKQLTQYRFLTMFQLIDWTQFVYSIQKYVLEALLALDWFPFTSTLSANANMQFWACWLAVFEMLVLSLLVTYLFSPSKSAFFDAHACNNLFLESCTLLPSDSADPENNGGKKELPSSMKETSPKPTPSAIMTADEIAPSNQETKSPSSSTSTTTMQEITDK